MRLEADYGAQAREVSMTPHLEAAPPAYVPRDPSTTVLYATDAMLVQPPDVESC